MTMTMMMMMMMKGVVIISSVFRQLHFNLQLVFIYKRHVYSEQHNPKRTVKSEMSTF